MTRQIHLAELGVFICLALNLFGRLLHSLLVYGYLNAYNEKLRETVRFSSSSAELAVIGQKGTPFSGST
jgi:hypothetical protein